MKIDYETAMGIVIKIRPRVAVADADQFARLIQSASADRIVHDNPDVEAALNNQEVLAYLRAGMKVSAIKTLRNSVAGMGLKEAKDAVESSAVSKFLGGAA